MHLLAVYGTISFINHCCVPNASLDIWTADEKHPRGQARLTATRAIPAGEEIFVSYIADHWLVDHTRRVTLLQNGWNFARQCVGCHPPSEAQFDADERTAASQYHNSLPKPDAAMTPAELSRHIDRINAFFRLLETLGRWVAGTTSYPKRNLLLPD
jgi:hypothetical protein